MNKSRLIVLSCLLIVGITALFVGIFSATSADPNSLGVPTITLITLDHDVATIDATAKDLDDTNSLVFCVMKEKTPDDCVWQVENEFSLDEETTFYAFVKDLRNNSISSPYSFDYIALDYENLRM